MTIKFAIAAALVALTGIFTVVGCVSEVDGSAYDDPCSGANDKMSACFVEGALKIASQSASASASTPLQAELRPRYVTQGSAIAPECTGLSRCEAGCINRASCDQLKDVYSENPTAASTSYASCLTACSTSQ